MHRNAGVTLVELMIVLAILAIISAVAIPSYTQYTHRAIRSRGQQFLMDIAQRQEQYFLDQRQYGTALGTAAGQLNMMVPTDVSEQYNNPVFTVDNAATPPVFAISLTPKANMATDGILIINNLQQRWRETDGNSIYDSSHDCLWEDVKCTPSS